ncbi:MAG: hypothetical protein IT366_23990 [Candidatus Hydrogenedentes bacterium]|nr:hypothetical protein [Candidatus Hydrogenedentota bacterium]
MSKTIAINRAPVLTLWAAVVAERMGYKWDEALSLGQCVAGKTAHSKAKTLGLRQDKPDAEKKPATRKPDELIELCGRQIAVIRTKNGLRALNCDKETDPAAVQRYLAKAFGEYLDEVTEAMRKLASKHKVDDLCQRAFGLYEKFRPVVDYGVKGWGQKGTLDIERITALE